MVEGLHPSYMLKNLAAMYPVAMMTNLTLNCFAVSPTGVPTSDLY